jgi:hypothetical protein
VERRWLDIISIWNFQVDDTYERLLTIRWPQLRRSAAEPTFSESEVIRVALVVEACCRHEEVGYASISQYLSDLCLQLLERCRICKC